MSKMQFTMPATMFWLVKWVLVVCASGNALLERAATPSPISIAPSQNWYIIALEARKRPNTDSFIIGMAMTALGHPLLCRSALPSKTSGFSSRLSTHLLGSSFQAAVLQMTIIVLIVGVGLSTTIYLPLGVNMGYMISPQSNISSQMYRQYTATIP